MTRVLLLQLDGKLPNIALMRIAAHHRALAHDVELLRVDSKKRLGACLDMLRTSTTVDATYASLIFTKTRPLAEALLRAHPSTDIGGTGWDVHTVQRKSLEIVTLGRPNVPPATLEDRGITTHAVDYTIYPGYRSSIGFLQRGCRFRCSFCVVPPKEGKVREVSTVARLWRGDPWPREIVLLDNDFFGNPSWRDRIRELRVGGFKASFNQGINARLLDREQAVALASVNYRDGHMNRRRLYVAWDNRRDERALFRGLDLLVAAGVNPRHLMVYMLIGYWPGETHADRDYRRAKIRAYGAVPYPMPYTRSQELVGFQRWCVGAYDKTIGWDAWTEARWRPENMNLRKKKRG